MASNMVVEAQSKLRIDHTDCLFLSEFDPAAYITSIDEYKVKLAIKANIDHNSSFPQAHNSSLVIEDCLCFTR